MPFPSINDDMTSRERSGLYDTVLSSCLDAVVAIDALDVVVMWNGYAENLFGYTRAEAMGRFLHELIIPPDMVEAHIRGLRHHLATGERKIVGSRIEIEARGKHRERFSVELTVMPLEHRGEKFFVSRIRDISERRSRERDLQMVAKELDHRVKNTLAIFMGIARQTARVATTLPDFIAVFEGRVMSYKRTHDLLSLAQVHGVDLRALYLAEFAPFVGHDVRVHGPDLMLTPRASLNLGMCIHEMVTNSVKHGSLSVDHGGSVDVSWTIDDHLTIDWIERGGPAPNPFPASRGFGSRLIGTVLRTELRGTFTLDYPSTGLVGRVVIPMSLLIEEKS